MSKQGNHLGYVHRATAAKTGDTSDISVFGNLYTAKDGCRLGVRFDFVKNHHVETAVLDALQRGVAQAQLDDTGVRDEQPLCANCCKVQTLQQRAEMRRTACSLPDRRGGVECKIWHGCSSNLVIESVIAGQRSYL